MTLGVGAKEVAHFSGKCPDCVKEGKPGDNTMAAKYGAQAVANGLGAEGSPWAVFKVMTKWIDEPYMATKAPLLVAGKPMTVSVVEMDVCLDCGRVFAVKVLEKTAPMTVKMPGESMPPPGMPGRPPILRGR